MGPAGEGGGSGGRFGPLRGGELQEQRWLLDPEGAEDLLVLGGELGPLPALAGVAGERDEVQALEFVAEVAPGIAGVVLGDADQQQRQPTEQHVRSDPLFLAMVDRAQVERGLHVAPGALDLQSCL